MAVGTRVRSLVELLSDTGTLIPKGSRGMVVGNAGERPVVDFEDPETGDHVTAECWRWEVRPLIEERVRR